MGAGIKIYCARTGGALPLTGVLMYKQGAGKGWMRGEWCLFLQLVLMLIVPLVKVKVKFSL
jgi:hypothetical protein